MNLEIGAFSYIKRQPPKARFQFEPAFMKMHLKHSLSFQTAFEKSEQSLLMISMHPNSLKHRLKFSAVDASISNAV